MILHSSRWITQKLSQSYSAFLVTVISSAIYMYLKNNFFEYFWSKIVYMNMSSIIATMYS